MDARDAVQKAMDAHLVGQQDMDPAIVEYVTDMATNILEDGGVATPKDDLVAELVDSGEQIVRGCTREAHHCPLPRPMCDMGIARWVCGAALCRLWGL